MDPSSRLRIVPPGGDVIMLTAVQTLRGAAYLADGAISATDLVDGCYHMPNDEAAWHICLVHPDDPFVVTGALRIYMLSAKVGTVGGWVADSMARQPGDGAFLALAAYALARQLGGVSFFATATVKHNSARFLQTLGGQPVIASYFDAAYNCDMSLLWFDPWAIHARFEKAVAALACHPEIRRVSMAATA